MADTDSVFALRNLTLSTFRVTTFVVAVVIYSHVTGGLGKTLSRLDTETGAGFFLAFWALTWYITRISLRRMTESIEHASPTDIVGTAAVAGGWNGVGVYAGVIVISVASSLANHVLDVRGVSVLFFALVVFGGPASFTVGAVVGALYGLFETLFLGVGSMLFDRIVHATQDDAALSKASTSV
jgi:hypothetical protein